VNDYIGGTTINAGLVQLNGTGASTADGMVGVGPVVNNATLIANNANLETISGNLSGSGLLVQQGVGTLALAGNNAAYSGPVSISSGTALQVGNGVSGTPGTGPLTNNGSLTFNPGSASVAVSGNITGSGAVSNLSGTVTLNGSDTYAGITSVAGGTLRAGTANAIPPTTTLVVNDSGSGSAGAFDMNGQNFSIASLMGTNTGTGTAGYAPGQILNNGSGVSTLTLSGLVTNVFYGQFVDNNNAGTGKVALALLGGPNLTLSSGYNAASVLSANTFSGGITVSNAELSLGINGGAATVSPGSVGTAAAGLGPITMVGTNAIMFAAGAGGSTTPTLVTTVGPITVPTGSTNRILCACVLWTWEKERQKL